MLIVPRAQEPALRAINIMANPAARPALAAPPVNHFRAQATSYCDTLAVLPELCGWLPA